MKNSVTVNLSHSSRRPLSRAWCASSKDHTAYGSTEKEALAHYNAVLEAYDKIKTKIQLCAEQSACVKRT